MMKTMAKNDIKLRQICFVFLALMPVSKVLMLPSITASFVNEQLWLPICINFAVDLFALLIILKLSDRFPNRTFYAILTENVGEWFARTIFFLYGIFFFLKSFIPILEQKYFVDNTLYEVFPNIASFFPLLILSTYASIKGLKALGRCADLAIWFTALGFLTVLYFSVSSCDLTNLFPIFQKQTQKTLDASFTTVFWYGECTYMLLFLGHFDEEKNKKRKIMLSYFSAAVAVTLLAIIFYGIFGAIAQTQLFAISDMSVYTTKMINIGRFDYVAIFMMLFSKIFAICLPVFAATKCFERAFKQSRGIAVAIVVNICLFIGILLFAKKFYVLLSITRSSLNWYFVFMGYVVPLLLFIFLRRNKCENIRQEL